MNNLLTIFNSASGKMLFLRRFLRGPLQYIAIEIIVLIIQKYMRKKKSQKPINELMQEEELLNIIHSKMIDLDENIESRFTTLMQCPRPHWLVIESWAILAVLTLISIGLVLTIIFCKLTNINRILISFLFLTMSGAIRLVLNYRFQSREKSSAIIEAMLMQTLISMYSRRGTTEIYEQIMKNAVHSTNSNTRLEKDKPKNK